MREHLKHTNSTIPGWDGKPTQTPTSYMMTTKFKGVQVAEFDGEWWFTKPLTVLHAAAACLLPARCTQTDRYIRALGLTEDLLLRRNGTGKRRDQKISREKP